jgi:uncharacterized protein
MSTALAVVVVLTALAVCLAAERVFELGHVPVGVALAVTVVLVGRAAGLRAADVGVARHTWLAGLRWGCAATIVVAAGYAIAGVAVTNSPEPRYATWGQALFAVLVVIPMGTVIAEELTFRGVLFGLLRRGLGSRAAIVLSSVLFGVWHVPAALGGGPANAAVRRAVDFVGTEVITTGLLVAGAVAFTAGAGVLLCLLRQRSDSLLAPMLLHWAVNGFGVLFLLLG